MQEVEDEIIVDSLNKEISNTFYEVYKTEEEIEVFLRPYIDNIIELKIGFHEILANAVEHGNDLDPDKSIKVKVIITKQSIKIIIEDQGVGFDWYDKLVKELDYNDSNERGRGIIIARKIYNKVEYNEQGNKVCLVKSRQN
ncbi:MULTISPECIES: ATP-binding protein [unclassified Candidatus Frackibacter]|uniref:ATP-binding protein n=1 Tax=unclassified Candidatus Frackibacter TaxID=2648818 RepID=UPI0007941256|nr:MULTISPECIES: ATP-binding protein [unclassified Candidatus Frackibacter]KXS40572.1 MAG: anti-sigma regulatory factor [Candidatus Frackibacter sp. T328-2]SDC87354.1 serine/threonine-protein kinase RsbW [Candidatus Frackibacter sp. WG11]SEN01322.1 serine/threonine-protein kinase RsbW [Candidatus Frackibacter sp. WG12]SFM08843.1 serine/threonine-protein kinase RsbW [Candidatus Frackibacter sp. WG13]